ncbi:MAG: phosphohydrolase [Mesoaciditoga sp.]|uniref:HDIG domain-containing metalloprotein n=1 Tax=Athalassotoga sp. TaxID=2022597 RepID=UPI000CBEAE92|nr:MAG: phosphohydrolase [Mesoaciditoga sp.]HEU23572.1 HDIG domain-containing protein [Mesoaciditoga lauensis]
MTREEAISLVRSHVKSENLVNHMIATGAVMKALAKKMNEDENEWEIAGILHDYDYPETENDPGRHGFVSVEMLKSYNLPQEIYDAILAHAEKKSLETKIERALYVADPTTGFITAAALIRPEKKLEPVDTKFLIKRFKEKSFAKGASREQMAMCSELGLTLEEYFGIALEAMKSIHEEINL